MSNQEPKSAEVEKLKGRIRQLETMVNEMKVMKDSSEREMRRLNRKLSEYRSELNRI